MKKARLAAENPLMGAPRPELGPNARILIEGRYLIIYEPAEDGVTIIAIVHGARAPESWLAS
jgi:toxin ParE1/3/4